MTSFSVPALAPLLEASPTILRLAIPRLAPVAAAALAAELAVPLLIVGTSYAAFQALHYWTKTQNDAIQAKATQNYCTLNPDDPSCGSATFTGGQTDGAPYNVSYRIDYGEGSNYAPGAFEEKGANVFGPVGGIRFQSRPDLGHWSHEILCRGAVGYGDNYADIADANSPRQYQWWWVNHSGGQVTGDNSKLSIQNIDRNDGQPDTGGDLASTANFSNLSSAKQQTALQSLSDNDWKSAIASTSARQLQEGETINQPVILTGDPTSTIPQERVPRAINFPGTVPAVAANPGIYIPATQDNTVGLSIPGVQNIPNINQGESTRIQTQTGYIEVSPTGKITIGGSPSTPLPNTAAPPNVGNADIWGELQDIKALIGVLPLAAGAVIAPAIARVPNLAQVGSAAETATCNIVSGRSPCSGNPLPGMNNKLDDIIRGLGLAAEAGQGAILNAINSTVNTINSKMGGQVAGGLSGFLQSAFRSTYIDKILNAMNLVVSLHNASMLSRNLGATLGELTSQALATIGIKDAEGSPLDINGELGKQANAFMAGLLGAQTWQGTKLAWNKANTIISSASQIVYTVRSIADSAREVTEWIANNTGKIGNALKRFRVVGENAFPHMSENVTHQNAYLLKIQRYREGVESLDDAASSLQGVLGEVGNIQSEFNELNEQKQKFDKAITDAQPKTIPDNSVIKAQREAALAVSKAPTNAATVFRGEGETPNA